MPTLRLFAQAREAAGTGKDHVPGDTVAAVVAAARLRYGDEFSQVADICKVWVNGRPAAETDVLSDADEVALLPPVSGG